MSHILLDSTDTVQVYGPNLVSESLICTIQSFPSGAILVRVVPQSAFDAGNGGPLCTSLSEAVEQILEAGVAIAATGNMRIDDNNLLVDYVDFTVAYAPAFPIPGQITTVVPIPVQIVTADLSIIGGSGGIASAPDLLSAAYQKLAAMATG